jgi:hypothetical protein
MSAQTSALAPGARVLIRDAEWIVKRVDPTGTGGRSVQVVGVSEIVRHKEARFLTEIEGKGITVLDPAETELVPDTSPQYRDSRLYLESLLRQSPPTGNDLWIGHRAAIDDLPYQLDPALLALEQTRQRILMADAVGLGKTIEIGILLSELINRGKGKRILVVTTKSMMAQFQKELWSRFTIPLVRLDSVGLERVRNRIPGAVPDISEAYFIDREEVPFGFEFFRKITLREVNFGEKIAAGPQLTIAGRLVGDKPFELCGACGKVKKNGKLEHAVYCRYWGKEEQEKIIEACFLYREFTSEAIRMLLPVASFEVDRNIDSFVAALDLGLRLKFRGDPGHLLTTVTDEPVAGSDVRKRFLVLYDGVPGGTGYLKELMRDQQSLIEVFEKAYDVLNNCTCQSDPEKDGCYRCLLAYRGRHYQQNTSRRAALELLKLILDNRLYLKRTEKLDAVRINRLLESELEGRFIEALRRTPEGEPSRSITHHVVNGKEGSVAASANSITESTPSIPATVRASPFAAGRGLS